MSAWDPERSGDAGLAEDLKAEAVRVGFDRAGIAEAKDSEHGAFYRRWLERGHHGTMDYLARPDAIARREALHASLPGVRSVLVVADAYLPDDPPGVPDDPAIGVVARYARGADYHRVVRRKLQRLQRWLAERLRREDRPGRVYVDTGPVLERELARRAGLGWFGRNTMLIHPRRGSYFFLGALLLEIPLPPDEAFTEDHCGTCRACLDACPTSALLGRDEDGAPVMDARRCISYLTIELQGSIPRELRPAIGNRVFGCDICQEVCPWNRRFAAPDPEGRYAARGPGERPPGVEATAESPPEPHPGTLASPLVDLLETALDERAWESFSRASAIRRAGRAGFARNVCVALGNWGSPEAIPVLTAALSDPAPLAREHAAWALGEIGTPDALAALSDGLEAESEATVVDEIRIALGH
ncbi:MAG: tRNA epoxyqueuosine(34) reductase QueG [Gemmatimonadota bacterium]|nr:tRNA epoxyqueuosine(34) reductase QueG [Gemmatimonadota bacterium]